MSAYCTAGPLSSCFFGWLYSQYIVFGWLCGSSEAAGAAAAGGVGGDYPELLERIAGAVLNDGWAGEEMQRLATNSFAGPFLQALLRACTYNQ